MLFVVFSTAAVADPFPNYASVDGSVQFWKQVFTDWSMGQVAVHDMDEPGIVYEVVDLPGPIEDGYTEQQQEFIEKVRERWEDKLRALARKASRRRKLTTEEKRLALMLTTGIGTHAVEDAYRRVRTQRGLRQRFRRGIEISYRYDAKFREIFRDAGLPEDLAYLPHVESSFQASARSSAGAVGVWQFTAPLPHSPSYLLIDW